MTIDLYTLNEK